VRLLSLDVDGVQTDGGLYYSESGEELRRFHVRDGVGIKQVLAKGLFVVFVTQSSTPSIAQRARRLGITCCLDGTDDKLEAVARYCAQLGIGLDKVAHMGDDVNDMELMRAVGCPVTVADARPEVVRIAVWTSTRQGGAGAVREFCDMLVECAADLRAIPLAQRQEAT
jgi:3-deoxy-D-manno-octulosonate 8-phosphate phosphatase (KDO 8-P phosphatase)